LAETSAAYERFGLMTEADRRSKGSFRNRQDAGRQLGAALRERTIEDPLVLALPRGGVPVAAEVAAALRAPLELLIARKIGAPGHAEFGLGAVVEGPEPQVVLNPEAIDAVRPPHGYVEAETRREIAEIARRRAAYAGGRPPPDVAGRTVILVDDGIATGGTVRAALSALRAGGAKRIVLAVPVAPADIIEDLRGDTDDIAVLLTPDPFLAVSQHYRDFTQVSDDAVKALLLDAAGPGGRK
jgi:putative phosphoribosyl transferase